MLSLIGCQTTSGVSLEPGPAGTPRQVGFMPVGQQVVAPLGYLVFCQRAPGECAAPETATAQEQTASLQESAQERPVRRVSMAPIADRSGETSAVLVNASFSAAQAATGADHRLPGLLVPLARPDRLQAPASANRPADTIALRPPQDEAAGGVSAEPAASAAPAPDKQGPFALTAARWQQLTDINASVNRQVRSVRDDVLYQRNEWWAYPTNNAGDCEDYALMKRKLLIEQGWPASSLLLTVVRQWNGEGHAVLLAVTDKGEFVLDNMARYIVGWKDAPYQWVKRQSQEDPNVWVNLDPSQMRDTDRSPARVAAIRENDGRT